MGWRLRCCSVRGSRRFTLRGVVSGLGRPKGDRSRLAKGLLRRPSGQGFHLTFRWIAVGRRPRPHRKSTRRFSPARMASCGARRAGRLQAPAIAAARAGASSGFRELMVTRIAGSTGGERGLLGRPPSPGLGRAWTTLVSSGTGIQTLRPLAPWASMPRSARAEMKARGARGKSRRPSAGRGVQGSAQSVAAVRWSRWLTQPGPTAWRPRTRLIVWGSPARMARRRSGPSDLASERAAAQRLRPAVRVRRGAPAIGPR